jgi:hypothetical protein
MTKAAKTIGNSIQIFSMMPKQFIFQLDRPKIQPRLVNLTLLEKEFLDKGLGRKKGILNWR